MRSDRSTDHIQQSCTKTPCKNIRRIWHLWGYHKFLIEILQWPSMGYFYHPPKKSWEGYVFICVCLSVSTSVHREPHVNTTYDAFDLTVQVPASLPNLHQTSDLTVQGLLALNIWWQSLETCSKLFPAGPPPQCCHLVAIEPHTVRWYFFWNIFLFFIYFEIFKKKVKYLAQIGR